MTKEGYEKLLRSDYWRGFSYSLIKERGFICEDCGKSFYNERNKLQVHHLVYRDIYPWSYRPEELIVLCEDCHKRRHGLLREEQEVNANPEPINLTGDTQRRRVNPNKPSGGIKPRYFLYGILAVFVVWIVGKFTYRSDDNNIEETQTVSTVVYPETSNEVVKETPKKNAVSSKKQGKSKTQSGEVKNNTNEIVQPVIERPDKLEVEAITQSSPEQSNEKVASDVVKRAEEAGVSTDGTTLDILDRMNHANVVKQAEKAGVSTEGTTLDILDRMNHANVVKQAEKAGVSTEGTTLDILDRINHANVVKQAEKAGVSTEGTTLDILDRINHANIVKRAKEMGVSTEGTTLEIMERMHKRNR